MIKFIQSNFHYHNNNEQEIIFKVILEDLKWEVRETFKKVVLEDEVECLLILEI